MMDSILQETWRPVPGYSGYEVSNKGRVRSVERIKRQMSRWGHTVERRMGGKILSPLDNGKGYLVVGLRSADGVRRNFYIHRLVAEAFIERKKGSDYVNHKDFNTKNNSIDNLEWVTQRENVLYSVHHMRKPRQAKSKSATGEKYIYAKGNFFRLVIPGRKEQIFKTFTAAMCAKRVIMDGEQHLAR